MKYANFFCCIAVTGLTACAFNSDRNAWNYDGSKTVALLDTEQFLPLQKRDDSGQLLPYDKTPNPYTKLKGRIDKTAINKYIDARRAFHAQKYDLADQLLSELSTQEPKLSGPWVMRGDIAAAQNNLPQAIEHYVTALDLNPINFNAYLRLAKSQRAQGHFYHAQNTYARALALWSDGPELHLNLGVLYDLYLNRPLRAQAHMEAYALLSGGDNNDALAWLDEIRQRTGIPSTLKIIGPEGELEMTSKIPPPKGPDVTIPDAKQARPQELAATKTVED